MQHLPIFVYGTLKGGECRETGWPCRPLRVEAATGMGQLHDLGEFPALVDGAYPVAGELWHFAEENLPATLATLDQIEGYTGGSLDLYSRRETECTTAAGPCRAIAYFYAHPEHIAETPVIAADADGLCRWSGRPAA